VLALRRAVLGQFAGLLCELVEAGRRDHPRLPELTPAMSTALIGGINELVLSTVEEDGADRLDQLEETIVSFVESVLHHGEGLGADHSGAAQTALNRAAASLGAELGEEAAGHPWADGHPDQVLAALRQTLTDRGYEPSDDADGAIRLRNCPFDRIGRRRRVGRKTLRRRDLRTLPRCLQLS
jgi:hypothetical protein